MMVTVCVSGTPSEAPFGDESVMVNVSLGSSIVSGRMGTTMGSVWPLAVPTGKWSVLEVVV
jgi:hypothetical protein